MPKTIYTRRDLENMAARGVTILHADDQVVVTDEGLDCAADLGIRILRDTSAPGNTAEPLPGQRPRGDLRHRARNLSQAWGRQRNPPDVDPVRMRLGRLNRLRKEMARRDLGALVLTDPINIRYATDARNMTPFHLRNPARYLFLPLEGPVILFEFEGCYHLAKGLETIDEIRPGITVSYAASGPLVYDRARAWAEEIGGLILRHAGPGARIGLERFNGACAFALGELGYTLLDAQEPVERARAIKNEEEIKAMQWSMQAVETGVGRMLDALRPGISENELWAHLHKSIIEQEGEYIETRLLTSGPRTNPWFNETGRRQIESSDLVALDTDVIGPYGYYSDFSRTFYCGPGKPSPKQRKLYAMAYDQVQFNLALLKPGMSFREYAEKAWRIPDPYLANRYFVSVHGVGMTGEYPYIMHSMDFDSSGYDGIIEPNMTLCVESYIGEENGAEGVKLEQQVQITESGAVLMSHFPWDEGLLGSAA